MNSMSVFFAAVAIYVSGDPAGSQLASGIFYVLGPLLFAVGTLLRRSISPRERPASSRPFTVWTRTRPFEINRHSVQAVAKEAPQRRHANAI